MLYNDKTFLHIYKGKQLFHQNNLNRFYEKTEENKNY